MELTLGRELDLRRRGSEPAPRTRFPHLQSRSGAGGRSLTVRAFCDALVPPNQPTAKNFNSRTKDTIERSAHGRPLASQASFSSRLKLHKNEVSGANPSIKGDFSLKQQEVGITLANIVCPCANAHIAR